MITEEEVHYSGQEQEEIIVADCEEERLVDSLMNSFENLNQHTDVLIEEEKSEQHTEVLPKEEEAQKPYDFYFNNCFVSAGLVAYAGGNLAQMSNQIKMKEEDYVEEFNPWNIDAQLLERMLESHDSVQIEIIMEEGKDEREAISVRVKAKVGARVRAMSTMVAREKVEEKVRIRKLQREENKQQFEEFVESNNNLK